jgi:glutathione S-transferase
MKLYYFPPSPNARKITAVIAHLGLTDVERQIVNLAKGEQRGEEFLRINPMGKIPALVDGDLVLWESNAIAIYLCELHGPTSFYPQSARVRADIARWLFWEATTFSKICDVFTNENVRKPMLGIGEPDPVKVKEGEDKFHPLAQLLETALTKNEYLVGDALTLADFVVGSMLTYLERGQFPVAGYPKLQAWWQRLNTVEAWRNSMPGAALPA